MRRGLAPLLVATLLGAAAMVAAEAAATDAARKAAAASSASRASPAGGLRRAAAPPAIHQAAAPGAASEAAALGGARTGAAPGGDGDGAARAWSAAAGKVELAGIEARWQALAGAPARPRGALAELAELGARVAALARQASRGLAALREAAAEREADMAAVVASAEWRDTEALLLELRLRAAAIELERALAGDPAKASLARSAAEGFSPFVDAAAPELAAESRYGRGLARIAAGERTGGLDDLRAVASGPSSPGAVAARARLALAEALADGGQVAQALDATAAMLSAQRLPGDLALRAKLLRLRLLIASGKDRAVADGLYASAPEAAALAAELIGAGEPWRAAALSQVAGHEHLLPSGAHADATLLRLRAEAAARRGDAEAALVAYREAVARNSQGKDAAALEGLARAALAAGAWSEACDAVARLRALGRPSTREIDLLELRAAHGAWQAAPDARSADGLVAATERLRGSSDATADDRAEAAYRRAELARAAGELDRAIEGFSSIDAPRWRTAARAAALQCRALRHAREPAREPCRPLLRDLDGWLARADLPDDVRATAVALDGALRTAHATGEASGEAEPGAQLDPDPLGRAAQAAALARLRELPRRHPEARSLWPAVLRSRALLEVELGGAIDPTMLEVLPQADRPAVAAQIAADLRAATAHGIERRSKSSEEAAASLERARSALAGAIALQPAVSEQERAASRLELARAAATLGEATVAASLFRAELEQRPDSLSALRGLALAAEASQDAATARGAWERLAAMPDLPPAMREEIERRQVR